MSAVKVTAVRTMLAGLLMLGSAMPAEAQQVFAPAQGKVENVESKRDGTIITITYDLTSTDPTSVFKVALSARMDGMSFTPVAVTGDIGDEVVPGKGKKIVWQVTKDTDSQDYDLFRFSVVAVSGKLKEVPPPAPPTPPGTSTPPAAPVTAPAPPAAADLRGTWMGSYAGSATAELVIDNQTGAMFAGRLKVAMKAGDMPTELSVEGTVTMQAIELREVSIVSPGKLGNWNLGSGLGNLDADGRAMRGSGMDRRTRYSWTFTRQGPPPGAPAATAQPMTASNSKDTLSGTWSGIYAGFQAQLAVGPRQGATYTATLTVTTKKDKAPTVLDVELQVSDSNITLRESRVVMGGAVSNWNLGSGSGSLEAGAERMSGTGRDKSGSFNWAFAKVPGDRN